MPTELEKVLRIHMICCSLLCPVPTQYQFVWTKLVINSNTRCYAQVSEGLSAGAMLTCVAAAMIPEAITTGGQMAGFVLVIGFLAATGIKVLELMYYEQKQW